MTDKEKQILVQLRRHLLGAVGQIENLIGITAKA